jgi:nicotinate-nucleotide--dimethylbenzimidazole phosphoribosyltransferase
MHHHLTALISAIPAADPTAATAASLRLDRLTKPPGSLGILETLIVRLAAATGQFCPMFTAPVVLVAAGDHGVVAEGVSPYPQDVTAQMVQNFLHGGAAINALAANAGARVVVVDAGVIGAIAEHPELRRVAIRRGAGNILREPAMTHDEAIALILAGAQIIDAEAAQGLDILAIGEMGIGNSTAAACLTSVCCNATPDLVTGRGTGLDDAGLAHKRTVVAAALDRSGPPSDPLTILAELGGLELALLCGALLAAAARRIPIVLDGYIATSAALVANALAPNLQPYLIAGHCSTEPGHRIALTHLGLQPLLDLGMRLGEGSGAALALPIIFGACRVMRDMATFGEAGVSDRT